MNRMTDREQLGLAETLAAQVRATNTVWAFEAAEAIWHAARIIGQSARSGCLANVVAIAGKLLDASVPVSSSSRLPSHRLLARLLSSGLCLNGDDETVFIPFALPFLVCEPGGSLSDISLQELSEPMSTPLVDGLECLLLNDLYSAHELETNVVSRKSELGAALVRQLVGDPESGQEIPPGRKHYRPTGFHSESGHLVGFGVGLLRAKAPSHFLTCLILRYGGPETWDWFGESFVEALKKCFHSVGGGPNFSVDPLNPVLACHAVGAAQAQKIARSAAYIAHASFGDMARYRQVRRPGRPKRKVMLYEFVRPSQRLVDRLNVDFRGVSDDVPNEELGSIFDQELYRLGFQCSSSS